MKVSDFDYFLPQELIAQKPVEPRDRSRLLVLHKENGKLEHKLFFQIEEYFNEGDVLVVNSTKVIPARLLGTKVSTGAKVEIFLLTPSGEKNWEVLARPSKRLPVGEKVSFGEDLSCVITGELGDGKKQVKFIFEKEFYSLLDQYGEMPLPPYIKEELKEKDRYQTVYAKAEGSVAAPTAGLHFTPQLMEKLRAKGVIITEILLHVGLGTFRPVTAEDVREHTMHSEYYSISKETVDIINNARENGHKVCAVGTTAVRTLESASKDGVLVYGDGWTEIFIYPGFKFNTVDCMITNFHLPKSTLLMLVSAFSDKEKILHAYKEAVENKYRFFSFGDAMLII